MLGETGQPMSCQELIKVMADKKLWTCQGGKTPQATLYSAILREINAKGGESRFESPTGANSRRRIISKHA